MYRAKYFYRCCKSFSKVHTVLREFVWRLTFKSLSSSSRRRSTTAWIRFIAMKSWQSSADAELVASYRCSLEDACIREGSLKRNCGPSDLCFFVSCPSGIYYTNHRVRSPSVMKVVCACISSYIESQAMYQCRYGRLRRVTGELMRRKYMMLLRSSR